jgi:hypothetical protein
VYVSAPLGLSDERPYSSLLGLYLGDGWVGVKPRGGAQLIVVCDLSYPDLIDECWAAMILVSLHPRVGRYRPAGQNCVRLMSSWKHWATQSNPRNISVSHRTSVALLDSFVGAKS